MRVIFVGTFLVFILKVVDCFGLHEDTRFNSWYLIDFCKGAVNATSDIELNTEGPSSGGIFALKYDSPYYEPGLNCTVLLVAPGSYKILLSFSQVEIRNRPLDNITLEVEGEKKTLNDTRLECPKEDCSGYQFTGKRIQLNFSSAPNGTVEPKNVGFNSIVTAFFQTNSSTRCPGSEHFRCQNLRCIWRGLYCNGQNNCGDGSDEPLHCPTEKIWGILVIAFGAVCFCIFVPLFCFLVLWGSRKSINTTTSKYQPIPGISGSINDMDADNLPILTESDFLLGSDTAHRPHSYSFTYGSNTFTTEVQIHALATNDRHDDVVSKSLGKGTSPVQC